MQQDALSIEKSGNLSGSLVLWRDVMTSRGRWVLLLVILMSILFSSVGVATQREDRLSGPDTIEVPKPDWAPDSRDASHLRIQGTNEGVDARGEQVCSYGFDISERFDESKPQFISVTAWNPKTCEFEIEIIDLDRPFDLSAVGIELERDDESKAASKVGFASAGAITQILDPSSVPLLANRDRKMTVIGLWVDPPKIQVNALSVALRANITQDEVVGTKCKYGYDWLDETGWQRITSNPWNNQICRKESKKKAFSSANAAYFNPWFCATIDTWTYYDRMSVSIWSDRGGNDWHSHSIQNKWSTGTCADIGMIQWDGFATYPNEYFRIEHTD